MRSSFSTPRTARSTETPMDFEFTDRPSVRPVWASNDDASSPRKQMNTASPLRPQPTVTFGRVQDVPFMLNIPSPQTPTPPHWVPPSSPVVARMFPQPELRDVDMAEPSPPRPTREPLEKEANEDEGSTRRIATGGLRRVFKARQRRKERSDRSTNKARVETEDDEEESDAESENGSHSQSANAPNHYTLNVAPSNQLRSDKSKELLGYLNVFWQFSIVAIFLYIILLLVITFHRDVETRVSEYSVAVVSEIQQCATHYEVNKCADGPLPGLAYDCGAWDTCMKRDPTRIGRARVGAELLAEVANGFMETISWKTLAFSLVSLSFMSLFWTSLLSLYRSRPHSASPPTLPPPALPMYPMPVQQFRPVAWGKGGPAIENDEQPTRRRKLINGAAKEVD